jgi:hypothetical protein
MTLTFGEFRHGIIGLLLVMSKRIIYFSGLSAETCYPVSSFQFVANVSDILFSILTTFCSVKAGFHKPSHKVLVMINNAAEFVLL